MRPIIRDRESCPEAHPQRTCCNFDTRLESRLPVLLVAGATSGNLPPNIGLDKVSIGVLTF